MLKVKQVGSNMTQVERSDVVVLFSYSTPVAAFIPGRGYIKTSTHYSVTTTKHISKWIGNQPVQEVEQTVLDNLL